MIFSWSTKRMLRWRLCPQARTTEIAFPCAVRYMRERERERERASRAYTCAVDERQTHSTLGETRCARSSNGASIQQQQRCQCDRRTTTLLVSVLQSMTHWPAGNLLFCERSRSYASCLSVLGLNECLTCANVSTSDTSAGRCRVATSPRTHRAIYRSQGFSLFQAIQPKALQ